MILNSFQSKFQKDASFLLVEVKISIDCLQTDMMKKKDTLKLGTALVNLLQAF